MATKAKGTSSTYISYDDGIALEDHLSPFALRSQLDPNVHRCRRIDRNHFFGSDRLPFDHDRDRIIHCRQFRKLAGKTQLLIAPTRGDVRTRLTHTIAVYQIATSLARRFNLNLAAVEAMAFGHDVGHTPFGHAGENALNRILWTIGGFHHAAHSVRSLDHGAYDFNLVEKERTCGLNLTTAVRQGILKHGWFHEPTTPYHLASDTDPQWDLASSDTTSGSLEAQALTLADSIAYLNHDIDDLMLYGFTKILSARQVEEFFARNTKTDDPRVNAHAAQQEFLNVLNADAAARTKILVRDATNASKARITRMAGDTAPGAETRLLEFSPVMRVTRNMFYRFFRDCVYADVRISHKNQLAEKCMSRLHTFFEAFFQGNTDQLPYHIQAELTAIPPWWVGYFVRLDEKRAELGITPPDEDLPPRPVDNIGVACRLAAADVVADLTDSEALAALEAIDRPESTVGRDAIDRVLSAFPSVEQHENAKVTLQGRSTQLQRLFPVAGR